MVCADLPYPILTPTTLKTSTDILLRMYEIAGFKQKESDKERKEIFC